uniref:Uncharacterized protein n=1 Tax=Ditylenchus dipsaci TaxID=166011 RepID=A0A915E4P6_9BILA
MLLFAGSKCGSVLPKLAILLALIELFCLVPLATAFVKPIVEQEGTSGLTIFLAFLLCISCAFPVVLLLGIVNRSKPMLQTYIYYNVSYIF